METYRVTYQRSHTSHEVVEEFDDIDSANDRVDSLLTSSEPLVGAVHAEAVS